MGRDPPTRILHRESYAYLCNECVRTYGPDNLATSSGACRRTGRPAGVPGVLGCCYAAWPSGGIETGKLG